ncbi:ead/Ea22-like family protein [Pseudomonas aeruginosa]|uniref:ead/Ea22-like family protein n=1 Tax=Pseudomonas aeruginosa TaxID=287 RepID=UPI0007516416|nr:ead/Ea22-like family protein [Pseudomonas aeruginosa]
MTDHAELRRLAGLASGGNWYGEDSQVLVGKHAIAYCNHKVDAQFIGKANPKTVLALLDEIDGLSDELSACTEHPGGCGYWREAAKRRTEERDQFKEENEALRESLQALIHISDATGWEDHTCGEIAKARAALEGAKP